MTYLKDIMDSNNMKNIKQYAQEIWSYILYFNYIADVALKFFNILKNLLKNSWFIILS